MQTHKPAALIVVGGFAGTGKTAISRRLSVELGMPRLGSDTLGRTIKTSMESHSSEGNAYWIAYEVLFRLAEEFIQAGVSTILDLTMGWEFQWQRVDNVMQQYPQTLFLLSSLFAHATGALRAFGGGRKLARSTTTRPKSM